MLIFLFSLFTSIVTTKPFKSCACFPNCRFKTLELFRFPRTKRKNKIDPFPQKIQTKQTNKQTKKTFIKQGNTGIGQSSDTITTIIYFSCLGCNVIVFPWSCTSWGVSVLLRAQHNGIKRLLRTNGPVRHRK